MRGVRLRLAEWLQRSAGPDGAYAGGRRYARKGNYEVGIAAFARAERQYAERLGPTNPGVIDAMAQRAWCLIALGRLREGTRCKGGATGRSSAPGGGTAPLIG
jgi:hypothetical protein